MLVSIGPFNGCMCEQWIERMGCAVMHGLTITCDSTAVRDPWNGAVAASRLRGELRQLSRSPKCTSRQNCSSTWNSVSMAVKNPMDAQLNAAHSPLPTMSLVPMTYKVVKTLTRFKILNSVSARTQTRNEHECGPFCCAPPHRQGLNRLSIKMSTLSYLNTWKMTRMSPPSWSRTLLIEKQVGDRE